MKDRQNNPQRADKIWNRWMMDKNFKQTAGKKRTEMMRPVKDRRQTKVSEGRKQKTYGQYFRVCGQITVGSPARKGNHQRSIN